LPATVDDCPVYDLEKNIWKYTSKRTNHPRYRKSYKK
jgi:hypothetical protein